MPPIQLHKNDPITAASKPTGITPQTASASPNPTRTVPASTPATTTQSASNPPSPQPGARPLPPTTAASPPTSTASPPAPAPSYTAHHLTTTTHLSSSGPPQQTIPPPDVNPLPTHSTLASAPPTRTVPGPTTLPQASPFQTQHAGGAVGRTSLEGPPGYQQAADNSPYVVGGGALGTGGVSGREEEGMGAQAWGMLSRAGEALKKGEEAVWKAVRER